MAIPQTGEYYGDSDNLRITPAAPSEGLAFAYDGAFAAAGAARIFGVTRYAGVAGQNVAMLKNGYPVRLRIEPGEVLAIGDPVGVVGVAGRFGKVDAEDGTGILGTARQATTGSGTEFALCDYNCQGFIEPAGA